MKSRFSRTGVPCTRAPLRLFALLLIAFATPVPAATVSLDFACISHNSPASCAAGKAQLHADLDLVSDNDARFSFRNVGEQPSVIAQIYFDAPAGLLQRITALSFGRYGQVDFGEGARPANLPGGNAPSVAFGADFSLGAASPAPKNGLNAGSGDAVERLSVTFLLGADHASLRDALARGELRIGIHAQAFDGGFSESFVSEPLVSVPLPSTALLFISGLIGFAGIARRREQKAAQVKR